jgi:hypothetical protein
MKLQKTHLFMVAMLLFAWVVLEGIILVGLTVLKQFYHIQYNPVFSDELSGINEKGIRSLVEGRIRYFRLSSVTGWSINPNVKAEIFVSNSQGFRGSREYSLTPPEGVLRISTFGASMTHCDEVENHDTWQAQLEALEPCLEVLNFGVTAYGLDQAYLRYLHEGKRFQPKIVFIVINPQSIYRLVSVFRPFRDHRTSFAMAKPRFLLAGDGLQLLENPLPTLQSYEHLLKHPKDVLKTLGKYDYYCRTRYHYDLFSFLPSVRAFRSAVDTLWGDNIVSRRWMEEDGIPKYKTESEAYKILVRVLDLFRVEVQKSGAQPIVCLLPKRWDLEIFLEHGKTRYLPLLKHLELKGYVYADVTEAFASRIKKEDMNNFFKKTHYSPLGNRVVAKYLQMYLRANKFITHQDGVSATKLKQQ